MGRKKKTSNALAVQVDAEGKIKYDAIARQGQGKDKVYRQMAASVVSKDALNTHLKMYLFLTWKVLSVDDWWKENEWPDIKMRDILINIKDAHRSQS